jgi:hypothetical protein
MTSAGEVSWDRGITDDGEDLDEAGRGLYRRLVQVPWRLPMMWQGTDGWHNGACMPNFLIHRVAPWLMP